MTFSVTANASAPYTGVTDAYTFNVDISASWSPPIADLAGEIAISDHAPHLNHAGTIILALGGEGDEYWVVDGGAPATWIYDRLRERGWRVVDFKWDAAWWGDGPGVNILHQSLRYAELVQWVADRYPTDYILCYGQSGGAGEVGYALAQHGMGTVIDGALFVNGPTFTRLDYAGEIATFDDCEAGNYPPETFSCGTPQCGQAGAYLGRLEGVNAAGAISWSILDGNETLTWNTSARMIIGLADCTVGPTQGYLFQTEAVAAGNTDFQLNFISGMAHNPLTGESVGGTASQAILANVGELRSVVNPPLPAGAPPATTWHYRKNPRIVGNQGATRLPEGMVAPGRKLDPRHGRRKDRRLPPR